MTTKYIKQLFVIVFTLTMFGNQSQAIEKTTTTSTANNKITYMLSEKESTTSTIYDKIRHMFSVVGDKLTIADNKLTALDKALPTLTYKTLDFKTGIGMDFGSNGVAIGLVGNVYYNFTPNISAFTGVEYKYNMYQIKHKLSDTVFTPETRTKMDLLFKLGARFKVKENFKVSPYIILGMGYGSVKQETQYYSSNETTYENINTEQQTFKGTTKIIKTTNKYDVDGATKAVTNLDYESHKNNFNGNYGIKYQINEGETKYIPVYEIKSYNEAQNILNNGIDVYKNTMTYNSPLGINESYANLGILPVINLYKDSKQYGTSNFTLLEGSENGISHQYGYQTDNTTFNANNLSDVHQTIIGNNGRIFAVTNNQDYGEYAKKNTELYNVSSILNKYVNSALDNFGDLGGAVSITIDQDTLKQQLQSGELQLSKVNGLSQTQEIITANDPLKYNQTLMIIKAKNLKSGEDTYFYYLPNNDGTTISLSEVQKQIEEYNKQAIVDKREKLENSVTTTTEAANNITQSIDYVNSSVEKSNVTKINTIINQKQKVFFKGGLGLELMFYNRFFMKLEYKYAQLGATNILIHDVDSYKYTTTNVYNTDYTTTQTTNVNNIYQNQYTPTYINSGVLTNYNNGAIQGSDSSGNVLGIEIEKGELDAGKSTSITQDQIYNYGEKTMINQTKNNEYLGRKTYIENRKTTFHMHEISFGFGFYFL